MPMRAKFSHAVVPNCSVRGSWWYPVVCLSLAAQITWLPIGSALGFDTIGDWTPEAYHTQSSGQDSCLVVVMSDLNQSGTVTSADIICLIHYVFAQHPFCFPQPCPGAADFDCSGAISTADIIHMINFIFKNGPPPIHICTCPEAPTSNGCFQ